MYKQIILFLIILFGTVVLCFEFNVDANIMFTLSSSPIVGGRLYSVNGEITVFEQKDISVGIGGGVDFFVEDFLGEKYCFNVYSISSYIIPLEEKKMILKLSGSGGISFIGKNFENKGYFVRIRFDIFRRFGRLLVGFGGGLDQHSFENAYLFSFFVKINVGFGK